MDKFKVYKVKGGFKIARKVHGFWHGYLTKGQQDSQCVYYATAATLEGLKSHKFVTWGYPFRLLRTLYNEKVTHIHHDIAGKEVARAAF